MVATQIGSQELNNLACFGNLQSMLDSTCDEIAKRFNLYNEGGKPRKATIVDVLSEFTCLGCIYRKLSAKSSANEVDAVYRECHRLAVNILAERLYWLLKEMGYAVAVSTEIGLEYGKADIVITITRSGVNLKHQTEELIIEVKTGNSLSLSQLFRYLLSGKNNSIIIWRVRKRQILIFNTESLKPLLAEFATMISLRGNRLLSSSQFTCEHEPRKDYRPTQEELQIAIQEFSQGLLETLPSVIIATIQKLGLKSKETKILDIKQA
jgi:hypothetical protein